MKVHKMLCNVWGNFPLLLRLENTDSLLEKMSPPLDWLSPRELDRLNAITSTERRKNWLAGRYAAKTMALSLMPGTAWRDFELLSKDTAGQGIAPYFKCRGEDCPLMLSLSHTEHEIAVAMSRDIGQFGVDLVDLDDSPQKLGHIWEYWLTANEKQQVLPKDRREIARRWSLKEAAYKSMRYTRTGFFPLHFEVLRGVRHSWQIRHHDTIIFNQGDIAVLESRGSLFTMVCRHVLPVAPYFAGNIVLARKSDPRYNVCRLRRNTNVPQK